MLDGSGVQGNGHLFVFKQERGVCMRRDVRGEEAYPPASVVVMVVLVVVGHRAAVKKRMKQQTLLFKGCPQMKNST